MRASIVGDSDEQLVKIDINTDVEELNFKTSKNIHLNETNWILLKKLMVNELFGTIKLNLGFMIQDSGISKVHALIMSIRGVDNETVKSVSKFDQISWFLKELSEIKPDPSIVTLYLELYPEVDKQYFLSNLFRKTAFYLKQIPDLQNLLKSESLDEPYVSQFIMKKYQNESYYSVEFEKFMNKYLPIIVRYIMDASLNLTSKNNSDINIFSIHEFINTDKDIIININPEKVFADRASTTIKKTAETIDEKENITRDEIISPIESIDDKNISSGSEMIDDEKLKISSDKLNEQSVKKRSKGDEMEDYDESRDSKIKKLSKKDEKNKMFSNQELNEKIVPNTPIKDSYSDSVKLDEIPKNKKDLNSKENSSTDRQETVSKKTHAHDDL